MKTYTISALNSKREIIGEAIVTAFSNYTAFLKGKTMFPSAKFWTIGLY